jgi:hypothetical protein
MNRNAVPRILLLSVLTLAACNELEPTQPGTSDDRSAAMVVDLEASEQGALSRAIPGFGGVYLDESGTPTVYLKDVRQASRARSALASFAQEQGVSPELIQVVQARFDFDELNTQYNRVWPEAMEMAGAVFSDLDEAHNQILIGVEHAGAANAVRGIAARLKVPAEMIEVRVVEPIEQAATLRDNVNPKVGGLQIHFSNYLCTLGFNAQFGTTQAFITNSHCTTRQGGTEGTVYYQPASNVSSTPIATEVSDPTYFRNGACPKGKKCRYSDSSRANYNAGVAVDLGGIAATNGGNLTITGTHNITSEIDATRTPVPVGATVSKVGRSSGTTTGLVTNTCVNTGVQGSNIVQLCQTFVSAGVVSGDSGSPVFSGSGNVSLVGILWGGSGSQFVFSPLRSIKDELGNFSAH